MNDDDGEGEFAQPVTLQPPLRGTLAELEAFAIDLAIRETGNIAAAAKRLGIGRSTLYWKLRTREDAKEAAE